MPVGASPTVQLLISFLNLRGIRHSPCWNSLRVHRSENQYPGKDKVAYRVPHYAAEREPNDQRIKATWDKHPKQDKRGNFCRTANA